MINYNLKGKTAVVTGAFGKLGCIWVETLLEAGAKVAALDLPDTSPPQNVVDLQNKFGKENLEFFKADVTNKINLEDANQKITTKLGEVSILVNNAGIDQPPGQSSKPYKISEIPDEIFKKIFDVNVLGAFHCIQIFGKSMVKKESGSIINIGSMYGSVSPDERFYDHIPQFIKPPAYGASKAALANLTKYFVTRWGPKGVRINTLSPGGVEGEQDDEFKKKFCERIPLGRMAKPEELKGPLLFLASDASSYITGIELMVDGGYTAW